jgi:signal transduction histidine kinase
VPFAAFVAAGSSALVLWLHLSARQESLRLFEAEARANADFVRTAHLPISERTAESLSRVLGVSVNFVRPDTAGLKSVQEAETGLASLAPRLLAKPGKGIRERGTEAIALPIDGDWQMWFSRQAAPGFSSLLQPRTLAVLGAFWVLALALGAALARGIVRPLRLLASRLPQIDKDPEAILPGAERSDEIGQVARAYLQAREQLKEERVGREKAERLALLGRMATGLAHEIHNPLAAIRMHGQLMESSNRDELPGAADESLPIILSETTKIESLVSQWMFLARPEPPKMSKVCLGDLSTKVVRAHALTAQHADVRIELEIGRGFEVRGDTRRLEQAISNAVINAIQAMADGGELWIGANRSGDRVQLAFKDTGPGFSREALVRHHELFYSEKEGGMGIGLSVTSEILRAHGGELRVGNGESGAAVIFDLPAFS